MKPDESILSDDRKVMVTLVNEELIRIEEISLASPTTRYHIQTEDGSWKISFTPGDSKRVNAHRINRAQSKQTLLIKTYETADRGQDYEHITELIKYSASTKPLDLNDPAHVYTLWNDVDGHMVYMGSFRDSQSAWTQARRYTGPIEAYIAVGPLNVFQHMKVEKG